VSLSRAAVPSAANTPRTQSENRVHYPALDGIRTVAFAMVFCQHYLGMPWGYTGVDLFFVLSGFLITGILFDTRDRPDRVRSFFTRRVLRIFPLYYGLLLLFLLLTPLVHFHWSGWWMYWVGYLGNVLRFVHPYSRNPAFLNAAYGWLTFGPTHRALYLGQLWSLCVEEQFYLVWPAVVFLVGERQRLLWLCGAVVLVMPLVRVFTMSALPPVYTQLALPYTFTPLRVDALLLGGWLALMIRGQHRGAVLRAGQRLLWIAAPLLLIFLVLSARSGQGESTPPWALTWGQSLVDVLYAAVIAAALLPGTLIYRICSLRPLRRFGQVTYGAYIFHDIPQGVYTLAVERLGREHTWLLPHSTLIVTSMALATTVPLAFLSYRYFETPFLNLKERWAPSR
jgi:peptidoglycan/LPS O-acetylase OafA/YrhL